MKKIINDEINELKEETLTIKFTVFEDEHCEFLSAIFLYDSPYKSDENIVLCRNTDKLAYSDFINIAFKTLLSNPNHQGNIKLDFILEKVVIQREYTVYS